MRRMGLTTMMALATSKSTVGEWELKEKSRYPATHSADTLNTAGNHLLISSFANVFVAMDASHKPVTCGHDSSSYAINVAIVAMAYSKLGFTEACR